MLLTSTVPAGCASAAVSRSKVRGGPGTFVLKSSWAPGAFALKVRGGRSFTHSVRIRLARLDTLVAMSLALLNANPVSVAPRLLGARLSHTDEQGKVTIRLTEVEAYAGSLDPGSHAYRRRSPRNETMFGPVGHLYVYFTYGMHWCANIVCHQDNMAGGILLRAGEIIAGHDIVAVRRSAVRNPRDYARGPARLAQALGFDKSHDGAYLFADPLRLQIPRRPPAEYLTGPRVGVAGEGSDPIRFPWRFWLPGEPTVSVYRPAVTRPRRTPDV